jgi:hypothetical protein
MRLYIKACPSGLGTTNYRELIDLMKDHNKVNSLKWRSGSTDEDLPSIACATNQAEGERSVNVTKLTIINAMRANSLRDRNLFHPAHLMSTQNKSSLPFVPTSERNLLPVDNNQLKLLWRNLGNIHERIWGMNFVILLRMNRPIGECQIGMCSVPAFGG